MVVKVYRDRAIALLREIESVIVMIDDKYLLCAIEPSAGGAEQAYRAAPKIATLLPGLTSAFLTACQAVGRISDRNSTFSSGKVSGTLNGPVLAWGPVHIPPGRPGSRRTNRYSQTAPPVAKCLFD
ncbi:Uncharacterised protein [Klebsiella pneumoniae subsp. rhinoscleromatis]|nr:Uncharacterised protein [Klebsiella pneumoniae subsp. rhinoscleromatis]